MRYGVKNVKRFLRRSWRLFLHGMPYPTYHETKEDAMMAARLRGYHACSFV